MEQDIMETTTCHTFDERDAAISRAVAREWIVRSSYHRGDDGTNFWRVRSWHPDFYPDFCRPADGAT